MRQAQNSFGCVSVLSRSDHKGFLVSFLIVFLFSSSVLVAFVEF